MEEVGPRQIANILHVVAKNRYKTCLLPALERRAEVLAGEFNSQHVANTLWMFATMGRKTGGQVMELLDRRAEVIVGEFKSQEVANTLWVLSTMWREPGARVMELREWRTEVIAGDFNLQSYTQLQVWCTFTGRPSLVFLTVSPGTDISLDSTGKRKR